MRRRDTLKQHMAAIRMLFDHLVTGGVLEHNPALSVKAPRQKLAKGKTPVLTAEEAGDLLRSIETETVVGLRDRALIVSCSRTQSLRCWWKMSATLIPRAAETRANVNTMTPKEASSTRCPATTRSRATSSNTRSMPG
jgi:hypothetical protein